MSDKWIEFQFRRRAADRERQRAATSKPYEDLRARIDADIAAAGLTQEFEQAMKGETLGD